MDVLTAEFLKDVDGEAYMRTMEIFEKCHPRPDPKGLSKIATTTDALSAECRLQWLTVESLNAGPRRPKTSDDSNSLAHDQGRGGGPDATGMGGEPSCPHFFGTSFDLITFRK